MFERIEDYLYAEPERITWLGAIIAKFGGFLLVAGAVGQLATRAINILPIIQSKAESTNTLVDIYPTLPLWWVPESFFGVFVSAILFAAGIGVNLYGRKIDRLLKG